MGVIGLLVTLLIVLGSLTFLAAVFIQRIWRAAGELVFPARRAPARTPIDYGIASAEAISVRSNDGTVLHGWFAPAPGISKGTIVLSHGYAGDCSPDLVYVPVLNNAGYNVCLFDFRGHGTSEGNFTSLVYHERRDLLAMLNYLKSRGIDRVGLLGFSMGGAISLSTAPHSPMVAAVISDCTFAELSSIVRHGAIGRGVPQAFADAIGWLVVLLASLRLQANLFSADPIRVIGQIAPRPVFIMHGTADEAVPVSDAHRLYEAAGQPKELWIVPGARHRMIEEIAPLEYKQRVIAFFDRVFESQPARAPS